MGQLLAAGHRFVIAHNPRLPFADDSMDEVLTNGVPIDISTFLGPGIQSREVWRILRPGGRWLDNGRVRWIKP